MIARAGLAPPRNPAYASASNPTAPLDAVARNGAHPMILRAVVAIAVVAWASGSALAQFNTPVSTNVREKIVGTFVTGDSGLTPEGGDQIGAFAKDKVIGVFQYDSGADGSFSVTTFGDDPATQEKEGPAVGDKVTFKFYDSSTNSTVDLSVLNAKGEKVNLTFQGQDLPPLPISLPGFDLTPSREFDLTPGSTGGSGSGGGTDGGTGANYDINGDGRIDSQDAALVLRAVMGVGSSGDGIDGDVNGDGAITTADAIEILRHKS